MRSNRPYVSGHLHIYFTLFFFDAHRGAFRHQFEAAGVIGDPPHQVHGAGRANLAGDAPRGQAEEDAEGPAGGPVAQVPDVHHHCGGVIQVRHHLGHGKVDLVAPELGPAFDGQGVRQGLGGGGIVQVTVEPHIVQP